MLGRLRTIAILAALAIASAAAGLTTLPPLDRDEARFAQATAQMLETGDFIRINFQDDPRHKKPAGIHWLQAGSVTAFSSPEARAIWAYRLPSILGLVIAVLATYWAATTLMLGKRAAFASAALLAVGVLPGIEGGIAKTDAMLLGLTTLAMAAMLAVYADPQLPAGRGRRRLYSVLFWFALAAGVLVKGPITPMIAGLAVIALIIMERRFVWLRSLVWFPGPILAVLMIGPWLYAVQQATDGAFLADALGSDLGPKLVSGHEQHGLPPLTHTALTAFLFWPGMLFLLPGLALVYRACLHPFPRPEVAFHALYLIAVASYFGLWGYAQVYPLDVPIPPTPGLVALALYPALVIVLKLYFRPTEDGDLRAMRFLAAWAAPAWAVFELIPTKLPHYPLPLYPALALMAGAAYVALVERRIPVVPKVLSAILFALAGGLFTAVLLLLPQLVATGVILEPDFDRVVEIAERLPPATLLAPPLVAGALFLLPLMMWRAPRAALWLTLAAGLTFQWSARHAVAPSLEPLWVSARISEELEAYSLHPRLSTFAKPPLVSAGFNEPSLVFLTSTDLVFADGTDAARYAGQEAGRATLVEAAQQDAFVAELDATGATAEPLVTVRGINYSRGDLLRVTIYRTTQRARRPQNGDAVADATGR